jgi:hypothetical protein
LAHTIDENHRHIDEEENLRTEHRALVYIFLSALLFTNACAQNHKRPNWADNNFIPANTSRAYYAVRSGHSTVENRQVIRYEAMADISAQIETGRKLSGSCEKKEQPLATISALIFAHRPVATSLATT